MKLLRRLLEPPDGQPLSDLHFGLVEAKLDMPAVCSHASEDTPPRVSACCGNGGSATVPHDGTLLVPPPSYHPAPTNGWPRYLSADNVLKYAQTYMQAAASEECNVTQFMEAAALAVDSRNAGFVRPDALLVILVLADREDCSTQDAGYWAAASWAARFSDPNAACYHPAAGVLYPVDRYVERFSMMQPRGRVLVVVVGLEREPEWVVNEPLGNVYAKPYCNNSVQSTLRLGALVRGLNALGNPNVEAEIFDGCPATEQDYGEFIRLADRILAIVPRE